MLDEAVQKLPESLRSIIVLHYSGGSACERRPRLSESRSGPSRAG